MVIEMTNKKRVTRRKKSKRVTPEELYKSIIRALSKRVEEGGEEMTYYCESLSREWLGSPDFISFICPKLPIFWDLPRNVQRKIERVWIERGTHPFQRMFEAEAARQVREGLN